MAVTKRGYIFGTFIISCISVALLIGAFGTQNWVEGEAYSTNDTKKNSVNFGLFQGTYINRFFGTPTLDEIYMTCILGQNACALSCKKTSTTRKDEISSMLDGNVPEALCDTNVENSNQPPKTQIWFNGGVYVSSIMFLSLSLLLSFISSMLGVYNTSRNPINPMIGVYGIYIWNWGAAVCALLVLIIWGAHFSTNVSHNLSFTHIMIGEFDTIMSSLGISYWLVFISMWCNMAANGLLAIRAYMVERDRPPPTITIDKNTDDTIFLY